MITDIKTSDRRPLETRQQKWPSVLARRLSDAGATPNGVSLAGLAAGLGAAGLFGAAPHTGSPGVSAGLWFAAGVAVQLRLLCNMLDGLIAVECGKGGPTGDFFNEVPDRLEDAVILTAAGWSAGSLEAGLLAACAALGTAYVRAYRASRGLGQDFCGPGAKPHRMFVITMGALAAGCAAVAGEPAAARGALQAAVWAVVALALVTTARRAYRVWRDMSAGGGRVA